MWSLSPLAVQPHPGKTDQADQCKAGHQDDDHLWRQERGNRRRLHDHILANLEARIVAPVGAVDEVPRDRRRLD